MHFLAVFWQLCPFVLEHRVTLACLFCIKAIIYVSLASLMAVVSYLLTLLVVVTTYRYGQPMTDALYGAAFALAPFLAVCAGAMVTPRWLSRWFVRVAGSVAGVFPIWFYLQHGLSGDWSGDLLLFVATSLVGSIAAVKLISRDCLDHPVRTIRMRVTGDPTGVAM